MDAPTAPMLPPGISHPAKRCMQPPLNEHSPRQNRRGNSHGVNGFKLPPPPHHVAEHARRSNGPTPGPQHLTPRGAWMQPTTPRSAWGTQGGIRPRPPVPVVRGMENNRQHVPFIPSEGDMKIQLSSTTMAWVDRRGNILHSWKRTKRGTRGGKNRRHEHGNQTPRGACPTPRNACPTPRGGSPVLPRESVPPLLPKPTEEKDEVLQTPVLDRQPSSRRQYSDCSSASDCQVDSDVHLDTALVDSAQSSGPHVAKDIQVLDDGNGDLDNADEIPLIDPGSTSPQEMADLITRLYGLVNVLASDNEQLKKTYAEGQMDAQNNAAEVASLKQKLQQVTSERDMLQQQVLFQH